MYLQSMFELKYENCEENSTENIGFTALKNHYILHTVIYYACYRNVESFKSMLRVGVDVYKASFIMKE